MTTVPLLQQQLYPGGAVDDSRPGLELHFDPGTPMSHQDEAWTCSVYTADWCLRSLGIDSDDERLEAEMLVDGVVTPEFGLMDARGYGLAETLRKHLPGVPVRVHPNIPWDELLQWAGRGPIALGGRAWYHWVGVTGSGTRNSVDLANPAPGYKGISNSLGPDKFQELGPFSAVQVVVQ